MTDRINIEELKRMLDDPDVPEEDILPYVIADSENSRAFAPAIRANPELVEGVSPLEAAGFLSFLNKSSRKKRQRKYQRKIEDGWNGIKIVSEGDSWFQYPLLLKDVIDQLFDRYAIFSLGAAGDLWEEIVNDGEIMRAVRDEKPHILMLSGGGNDMVHDENLARMLHPGEDRPPEEVPNARFDTFLQKIEGLYRGIFTKAQDKVPELKIVIHGYDHAIPNHGKWLGKPMKSININDRDLQTAVVKVLIDRLNNCLCTLAGAFPGTVFYVNCRGAVNHRWHDELHPNNEGYADVAARFSQVIENAVDL